MKKRSAYRKKSVHPLLIQMEQKALREKWDAESVTAGIHALIGADKTQLISHSGLLFFVASGCAIYLGWTGDEPDFRIVSASINAIDDLKAKKEIEKARVAFEQEKVAAVAAIRKEAASLSLDLAEKVLKNQLKDKAAQEKLVSEWIADVKI